jgi:hypothetical protein
MVGGLAGGACAGVFLTQDRELALWTDELPDHEAHLVDQLETIDSEAARLSPPRPVWGGWSLEPVRGTASVSVLGGQIAAGNVENGVAVQVSVRVPKVPEGDVLRMAEQPGGLVVKGGHAFFEIADAKQDTETAALNT